MLAIGTGMMHRGRQTTWPADDVADRALKWGTQPGAVRTQDERAPMGRPAGILIVVAFIAAMMVGGGIALMLASEPFPLCAALWSC